MPWARIPFVDLATSFHPAMETASGPQSPDWDNSKENFQPLRRGRRASALKDSTDHPAKAALENQKR